MADGSFAQALEKRETVLDTRTGEMFDPGTAAHEDLVDVFLGLQNAEKQFKAWKTAVEDELVRRHKDWQGQDPAHRRSAQTVGDYEVDLDRSSTRVWDVEDLIAVTNDLVARGLLDPADVADLFIPQPSEKVNGTEAKRLVDHADGDVLIELSRCFTWKKGRAKVKVTPVVSLEP